MVNLRHDLHARGELAIDEHRTRFIRKRLSALGGELRP